MENQRIRVTKRMLKEALIRLLKQKSIEKIKVQELCTEAQINRTTFYKYYGSQYDLMDSIQSEFIAELEKHLENGDDPKNLVNVLSYIDEQREICLALLHTVSDEGFLKSVLGLSCITAELENALSEKMSGNRKIYTIDFILHGAYAVVRRWLDSENPESPEVIADIIVDLTGRF